MNNTNKKYYRHVYDKVRASDDLKERILNMGENHLEKKHSKNYRRAWRIVAAVAALAIAIPSVVYAAARYWGVGDFYATTNNTLPKEADNLIERDIAVQTQDNGFGREMPVDFEVKEAVCDSGCVSIVIQATAKEKGKYFLVDEFVEESYLVSNLGIDEDMTIKEYAESKGLNLLFLSCGFADEGIFAKSAYSTGHVSVNDDTLEFCLSTRKENTVKDLDVAMECSVRGVKGISVSSTLNFKLQDKSTIEKVSYAAEEKMAVKGTKAVVTKVTMERTEAHTYVKVYFSCPNKEKADYIDFRMRDEKGERWNESPFDGTYEYLGDGKYCYDSVYDNNNVEFPEKCILEVFDPWESDVDKKTYGQFEIFRELN